MLAGVEDRHDSDGTKKPCGTTVTDGGSVRIVGGIEVKPLECNETGSGLQVHGQLNEM